LRGVHEVVSALVPVCGKQAEEEIIIEIIDLA
jgi:hypothetical protein